MMDADAGRALLALLRERCMLLFVGAGLSFELRYPLWDPCLAELEKVLGAQAPPTDDLLERAEWIKCSFANEGRLPDYLAHIQQTFGPKYPSSTALQRLLVQFGFRGVVTTNFEPSLENAISAGTVPAGRPACASLDLGDPRTFPIFDFLRLVGRGSTTEFVLHLHGVHTQPGAAPSE
jgi:hypothetical protein